MTDIEVLAISKDGRRLSVKADGNYAVLKRQSGHEPSFVGKVAGKVIYVSAVAAQKAKGG